MTNLTSMYNTETNKVLKQIEIVFNTRKATAMNKLPQRRQQWRYNPTSPAWRAAAANTALFDS